VTVEGCFIQNGGKPDLKVWSLISGDYQIKKDYSDSEKGLLLSVTTPSGIIEISELPFIDSSFGLNFFDYLGFILREKSFGKRTTRKKPKPEDTSYLINLGLKISKAIGSRPYSIAPIRTRPQITYDPLKDIPSPEGSHIPTLLARMSVTNLSAWSKLRNSLDSFGKASGLFDDVSVRRMGHKEDDPFQIRVKISGPPFNLVFIGYGVSQVLPIVVDSLQEPSGTTFLLQQPEVHLHPKAQAELGSFLASAAKAGNKRFIIETHSDYLIDRIRMDVRDHEYLTEDDVVVLFFDRTDGTVNVHPIYIDKNGNLIDTPKNYRQFFLEEERRFLTGK